MMFNETSKALFANIKNFGATKHEEDRECVRFANHVRALQSIGVTAKFVWTHIANENAGARRPVYGMLLKAMGKLTGWPDYVFMWQGGCMAIEFKSKKGRLSPAQKLVRQWFVAAGVPYHICRSMDEGLAVLREAKLIT